MIAGYEMSVLYTAPLWKPCDSESPITTRRFGGSLAGSLENEVFRATPQVGSVWGSLGSVVTSTSGGVPGGTVKAIFVAMLCSRHNERLGSTRARRADRRSSHSVQLPIRSGRRGYPR